MDKLFQKLAACETLKVVPFVGSQRTFVIGASWDTVELIRFGSRSKGHSMTVMTKYAKTVRVIDF